MEISFCKNGFIVDNEKNLYIEKDGEKVLIERLKKNVYDILPFKNSYCLIDKFGDCFLIEEKLRFLFGILGSPMYFEIRQEKIYVLDVYKRIFVYDENGDILNIIFCPFFPKAVVIKDNYVLVIGEKDSESKKPELFEMNNDEHKSISLEFLNSESEKIATIYKKDGKEDLILNKIIECSDRNIKYLHNRDIKIINV